MVDSSRIKKLWQWVLSVIPAHAGIQVILSWRLIWMPVSTGMTDLRSALILMTLGFTLASSTNSHAAEA